MSGTPVHPPVDATWLARHREEVLYPELPIVDPHHHLWDRSDSRYLLDDISADIGSGHNVRATVFIECHSAYRSAGDDAFRPVGETEFVEDLAKSCVSRNPLGPRVAEGIIAFADLRFGSRVLDLLEAHRRAAPQRLKGIRQRGAWDASLEVAVALPAPPPHLFSDPGFRAGFAQLSKFGLTFDAWCFHPQLGELRDLASRFPSTPIVVDHLGGPVGIGPYRGRRDEVFQAWKSGMAALARLPNVHVKLGGLGMKAAGFGLSQRQIPSSSAEVSRLWRPYIETCIEMFGCKRCMLESNFQVDNMSISYVTLWNAFKIIAFNYAQEEIASLFSGTASDFYQLN